MSAWITNLLKMAFAAALITWLIQSGRLDFQSLQSLLRPEIVLTGVGLIFASILCASERWRVLLHAQGFEPSRFQTLKLSLIGIFFNFAMPGGVGGDIVKGFYIVRSQKERKLEVALTVLLDRVFGLYVMIMLAAISILLGIEEVWPHEQLRLVAGLVGLLALGANLGLGIGFSQKLMNLIGPQIPKGHLQKRILQVWEALVRYGKNPKVLLHVFLLSAGAQLINVSFYFFIGRSLGFQDVPVSSYLIACLVGAMMTAIPISPAGVGVGQASFAFLFSALMGRESILGASLATSGQITMFVVGLGGAWFYVRMKSKISTAHA